MAKYLNALRICSGAAFIAILYMGISLSPTHPESLCFLESPSRLIIAGGGSRVVIYPNTIAEWSLTDGYLTVKRKNDIETSWKISGPCRSEHKIELFYR